MKMTKMEKVLVVLLLVAVSGTAGYSWCTRNTAEPYRMGVKEQVAQAAEDVLGWNKEETGYEWLEPRAYADAKGNRILLYENGYLPPREGEYQGHTLIYDIFDPATAEKLRECQVGEVTGTFYAKDGRTYLWWQPDDRYILLLDFDPATVTEEEILKMAASTVIPDRE